jgi:hypothetical protein
MKGDDKMERFDGYLFSKLHLIGSKSEGPTYFLQQFDYKEYKGNKACPTMGRRPRTAQILG